MSTPHPAIQPPEVLTPAEVLQLMTMFRGARRVVLCAHRNPDGDAIGSSLALGAYLRSLGKFITLAMPGGAPDFLSHLPNFRMVLSMDRHEALIRERVQAADLVVCLDCGALHRLGPLQEVIEKSRAERIVIDHHLDPDPAAAKLIISRPEMCSTAELVFSIICALGGYDEMTTDTAACLYTAMMTDTGAFTYNSSRPEIYLIIGMLLAKGIDKDRLYRQVYNTYSEHRLRFVGYVLNEKLQFYADHRASIFTITREDMQRFHFLRGDAEGLVNMPLQVKGMRLSISLKEDTEKDTIRVSLRSVDDFPCNEMAAAFFNGGGHLNASGGELPFPLDEAVRTAERAIETFASRL